MAAHLIKSMTGFGGADGGVGGSPIGAAIPSANPRFLTPSIKVPGAFARIEGDVRELIRQRVARGHVTVSVRIASDSEAGPRIDVDRIAAYAEQLKQVQRKLRTNESIGLDVL